MGHIWARCLLRRFGFWFLVYSFSKYSKPNNTSFLRRVFVFCMLCYKVLSQISHRGCVCLSLLFGRFLMRQALGGSNMTADDGMCCPSSKIELQYDRGIQVYRHTDYDNSESLGASILFSTPAFVRVRSCSRFSCLRQAGLKMLQDRRVEVALRAVGKLGKELKHLGEVHEEMCKQVQPRCAKHKPTVIIVCCSVSHDERNKSERLVLGGRFDRQYRDVFCSRYWSPRTQNHGPRPSTQHGGNYHARVAPMTSTKRP